MREVEAGSLEAWGYPELYGQFEGMGYMRSCLKIYKGKKKVILGSVAVTTQSSIKIQMC